MPARISQHQIFALWDELADFPASEIDAALMHLMNTLASWIGADNALWIGGVRLRYGAKAKRDAQHGWRGRVVRRLRSTPTLERRSTQAVRAQDNEPALTTVALTARAGEFRAHRLRDGFVDFEAFRRTSHYQSHYRDAGMHDRMWIVTPVNADAESYFLLDLYQRRRFAAADLKLVGNVLRGLKWFHRSLMLSHGLLVADTPLSAAQRRVLALLLTGAKEADIARKLNLSAGTTHQYAVALYRKLGVKGRAGLMSLWLGQ